MKHLIDKHVNAIGSCGQYKGEKVFGILDIDGGDWIVTIIDENGWETICSIYPNTIEEV